MLHPFNDSSLPQTYNLIQPCDMHCLSCSHVTATYHLVQAQRLVVMTLQLYAPHYTTILLTMLRTSWWSLGEHTTSSSTQAQSLAIYR